MTVFPPGGSNSWNISLQAGGKLLSVGQRLSLDGNHFIALFRHQIKVYYLATRQCIKTIAVDLSQLTVVDSRIFETDPNLIYIFDKAGEVVVVNWKERLNASSVVQKFKLPLLDTNSILKIVSFDPSSNEALLICGKYTTSKSSSRLIHIVKLDEKSLQELLAVKGVSLYRTSINNNHLICLNSSNEVVLISFQNNQIHSTLTIPFVFKSKVTSVAVSNKGDMIALGTSTGIIQLIYSNDTEKPQRLLKWHIDQVKSIEFNQDDTYLLSGGDEKVLVFWQLNTDKQQFLPRLNGPISNIEIDPYVPVMYSLTLQITENDIEFLVLNSSDLLSRFTIDDLRPNFNLTNLSKLKKKLNGTVSDIKNDFTCSMAIHPITNHLYLPQGSQIQVYDYKKDEQLFTQTALSILQAGKVKSEQLILDPKIEILKFSKDGKWMCTFDSVPTPVLDNLLSTKDVHYSLKFWKFVEFSKDPSQSYWELSTKIIDPHGDKVPVVSIAEAPSTYHNGLAFVTADTKGGVRLWRPRIPKEIYNSSKATNEKLQQTAWILKRSLYGNGTFETNSVSLSWSPDASIIVVGYESLMNIIDCNTFKEIEDFHLPSLLGSRVRSVNVVDNNVVALAKNRIVSYDLLNAKNNELCGKMQTPTNGKNLIAIDPVNNLVALVINYFNNTEINSSVFIFKPQFLKPVYIGHHSQYIASIVFSPSSESFVFIDIDSRIGLVSPTLQRDTAVTAHVTYAHQLNVLLDSAKKHALLTRERRDRSEDSELLENLEIINGNPLNANSFQTVLENTEGIQIESLFERIMNVI